jgi:hypothetical protein
MSTITFSADLDNSKLEKSIKESKKSVQTWVQDIEKAGGKIENLYKNLGTESTVSWNKVNANYKREIGLIADLEKSLAELKESRRNANNIEDIEKFNRKIQEAELNLKEYTQAGRVKVQTDKEMGDSTETLTQKISHWALGLGGAAALLHTLKKAFEETAGGMNLFNNIGAVTKQVMYDIVSMQGLNSSRAAEALSIQKEQNALRHEGYITEFKAAQQMNIYQQLYSQALDATLPGAEKLKIIDEALAAHNKAIDYEMHHTEELLKLAKKTLELRPGDEDAIKKFAELNTKLENLEAARFSTTKRLTMKRSTILKEEADEEIEWRKKVHDAAQKWADLEIEYNEKQAEKLKEVLNNIDLLKTDGQDRELLQLKQKYDADMEEFADNEKVKLALTEEYALRRNEIELKYLKKLQEENKKIAEAFMKIDPGKGFSILNRALSTAGVETPAELASQDKDWTPKKLIAPSKWVQEKNKEIQKNIQDGLDKELETRKKIIRAVSDLVMQLGVSLGLTEQQLSELGASITAFQQAAEGDYIGAASTFIMTMLSKIPESATKFANQIAEINRLLEKQQRLIELADRTGEGSAARQKEIDILKEKEKAIYRALNDAAAMGKPTDDLLNQLIAVQGEIADAELALQDFMAGGITQNSIADAIAQGFQDGKTSADDFATYLNDVLYNAVIEIFKSQTLLPLINAKLTPLINAALAEGPEGAGIITKEEAAKINAATAEIVNTSNTQWQAMTANLDLGTIGQPSPLVGQITRNITEDTGTELAGLMRKISDDNRANRDYNKLSVDHLIGIEKNTLDTVARLDSAILELKAINTNTKPAYSNIGV